LYRFPGKNSNIWNSRRFPRIVRALPAEHCSIEICWQTPFLINHAGAAFAAKKRMDRLKNRPGAGLPANCPHGICG